MTAPKKQEFEMEQPWIVNFKFVVEGVAQATVGFVGMIGKNHFYSKSTTLHVYFSNACFGS